MTSPQSYEVIVLGGGKGGKTLATELGNKSVKMALIERSAEPGVQLLDMPDFPEAYKPEALGGREFLDFLRAEKILEWSFLCPSAEFAPGQRTGKFRLGKDRLLTPSQWREQNFYGGLCHRHD